MLPPSLPFRLPTPPTPATSALSTTLRRAARRAPRGPARRRKSMVILIVLAVVVVAVIAIYNGLVRLRAQADNAWADIDVQLTRRYALVPQLGDAGKGCAGPC